MDTHTETRTYCKQSVSFRWDSRLVESLKAIAKKQNRSLSNFTETILANAIRNVEEEPNETTKKAIEEARYHQKAVQDGVLNDDGYIDMSSLESMIKSALK